MVRNILAVVAGYATLALLIFVTFTLLYLMLGADRSFEPGSYDASALWVLTSFPLGVATSVAAGYVCAALARGGRAPQVLAGVVLVLGLLFAIPVLRAADAPSPPRAGGVSNMEAMRQARQPEWVHLVNPFVGAVGVLVGAGLRRRRAGSRDRSPAPAV
jgi:predicted anti-sigma-YlaC factor YlaD